MEKIARSSNQAPRPKPAQEGFAPQVKPTAPSNKIANNLQAAVDAQKTEDSAPEVAEFLNSIGLQKYQAKFVENGIEDQETILELNDVYLDTLGVPLGHKLKMLKRIKTIRGEKGMSMPQSR